MLRDPGAGGLVAGSALLSVLTAGREACSLTCAVQASADVFL